MSAEMDRVFTEGNLMNVAVSDCLRPRFRTAYWLSVCLDLNNRTSKIFPNLVFLTPDNPTDDDEEESYRGEVKFNLALRPEEPVSIPVPLQVLTDSSEQMESSLRFALGLGLAAISHLKIEYDMTLDAVILVLTVGKDRFEEKMPFELVKKLFEMVET